MLWINAVKRSGRFFSSETVEKFFLYNAQILHQSFGIIIWADRMLWYDLQSLH